MLGVGNGQLGVCVLWVVIKEWQGFRFRQREGDVLPRMLMLIIALYASRRGAVSFFTMAI